MNETFYLASCDKKVKNIEWDLGHDEFMGLELKVEKGKSSSLGAVAVGKGLQIVL